MSKFMDFIEKTTKILGGDYADQQIEEYARNANEFPEEPAWYLFFQRRFGTISLVIACLIGLVLFFLTDSKQYLSEGGVQALAILVAYMLAPFLLLAKAVFAIQTRLIFRKTLNNKQRTIYDASIKSRAREFALLFVVTLIVTVVAGFIIYYGFLKNA